MGFEIGFEEDFGKRSFGIKLLHEIDHDFTNFLLLF